MNTKLSYAEVWAVEKASNEYEPQKLLFVTPITERMYRSCVRKWRLIASQIGYNADDAYDVPLGELAVIVSVFLSSAPPTLPYYSNASKEEQSVYDTVVKLSHRLRDLAE